MSTFVLEIGFEEMPASFLRGMESDSKRLFEEHLKNKRIKFKEIKTFSTPRRLIILVEEINEYQDRITEIKTGPPIKVALDEKGSLTKAGIGFLKAQGAKEQDFFVHKTEKGEYIAVKKEIGGEKTTSLLPDICKEVILKIGFPKKMKWEKSGIYFGRPIRWLLALFDDEVIEFEIASVKSSNLTYGHRVMAQNPITISHAKDLLSVLESDGKIITSLEKRKEIIKKKGEELAKEVGGKIVWKEDLLEEVANLVEFPYPILGKFEDKYLKLPKEVLLTCMQTHQKCFGVERDGNLMPYFLCTLNLIPKDLDLVRKGWERVLRARLEDASFFWEVDMKTSFDKWFEELGKVVFIGPLGTLKDKSIRLKEICSYLSDVLGCDTKEDVCRAAVLCKTDLVSQMVGEFDDLQGIMGGIYALKKGESEKVATAIYDHYLPTGQESDLPRTIEGAILSIADKCDNIAGCFGLDMIPTGNQDPYALRRQAIGIIKVSLDFDLRFSLKDLFKKVYELYKGVDWKIEPKKSIENIIDFFAQRLKGYFVSLGFSTKLVDAAIGAGIDVLPILKKRLEALLEFSKRDDFESGVLTFKRAYNIIKKQGEKEGELNGIFKESLLKEPQEKRLAEVIKDMSPKWDKLWREERFLDLFMLLFELKPVVDEFFDNVLVMCEDKELRMNRLNLLKALTTKLSLLADFSALQV